MHIRSCDTSCSIFIAKQGDLISHRVTRPKPEMEIHDTKMCVFVVCFTVVKENQLHTQFVADQSRRELANGRGGRWRCAFMCACVLGGRATPA